MSIKGAYQWKVGEPPPILHVHSLAKHDVLRAYLSRYLKVLAAKPMIDRLRLTLIDGFSGGGLYLHEISRREIEGSPLIFLNATREAEAEINVGRKKLFNLDAHYIFVEKDRRTLEYLRRLLADRGHGKLLDDRIKLLHGEFIDKAREIIQFIRNKGRTGRAIFLLDQYGYKDVPFPLLRELFAYLPSAEVILTFAVDALIDYLGDDARSEHTMASLGLNSELDVRGFSKTRGASDRRFFIQSRLAPIMHKNSGALFFTPFFIVSRESNRDYWLVHLSMHSRARDEMAKLHWELHNYFRHNGGAGLRMIGYDPSRDDDLWGRSAFEDFNFDAPARARSLTQLRTDLPELLIKQPDGISFADLMGLTCNSTPATSDLYRETLGSLLDDKEIRVVSPDGVERRKGQRILSSDVIRVSRQVSLFFRKQR